MLESAHSFARFSLSCCNAQLRSVLPTESLAKEWMILPLFCGAQLRAVLRAFRLALESSTYLRTGFRGAGFAPESSTYFGTALRTEWLALATRVPMKFGHRNLTAVGIPGFNHLSLECS